VEVLGGQSPVDHGKWKERGEKGGTDGRLQSRRQVSEEKILLLSMAKDPTRQGAGGNAVQ